MRRVPSDTAFHGSAVAFRQFPEAVGTGIGGGARNRNNATEYHPNPSQDARTQLGQKARDVLCLAEMARRGVGVERSVHSLEGFEGAV